MTPQKIKALRELFVDQARAARNGAEFVVELPGDEAEMLNEIFKKIDDEMIEQKTYYTVDCWRFDQSDFGLIWRLIDLYIYLEEEK